MLHNNQNLKNSRRPSKKTAKQPKRVGKAGCLVESGDDNGNLGSGTALHSATYREVDFKAKIKEAWPAILILLVAAVARLTLLGMKPPHFDEGVNGWFVDQLSRTGYYHYDPTNYHGPLHFYILFLFQSLFGRHIWALRLPLALASLGAVWFTMKFDRFMGRKAALWAAAAMAVSPGCVFYGRYAIHEYWLVLSLMAIAWGMAGLWKFGEKKYLWAIWIGVTGAVLTKETYILHFACALAALGCLWILGFLTPTEEREVMAKQQWTGRDMALGALMFAGCVIFFYSGGFMDIKGLRGLYLTFAAWAKTGRNGNGHDKPWEYWLKLCSLYEWPALAGIGMSLLWGLPPKVPRAVRWAIAILGAAAAVFGICGYCASLHDAHIEFSRISFSHSFSDMLDLVTPRMLLCIIPGGALIA
ncbi:MAG TPA: glycosyltransferase family 39 protein, partial [Chthoniobacteraceae bacterium]|nr:glycosyltransferase family 39 protein [Chthoniobacteraceae bacterium]